MPRHDPPQHHHSHAGLALSTTSDPKDGSQTDAARLLQDAIAELGWSADPTALARLVQRLHIGLPREDEFSVVCAWLGNCELLHKLDQQQVPVSSRERYQVPDLLAKFSTQTQPVPVLIEIKSKNAWTLSLRPDYLERLQNYASLVRMPLLIAWKYQSLWVLFEAKHLKKAKKNFNISFDAAMKENLMGALAGDVAYSIYPGAGVHLRMRKERLISLEPTENGHLENWHLVFDQVKFTGENGREIEADLDVQSLFTSWDLEESIESTDTHIQLHYVAGADQVRFAHAALVRLLQWESPKDEELNWRQLLQREQVTRSVSIFSAALRKGLAQHVVHLELHQQPETTPDFLTPPE